MTVRTHHDHCSAGARHQSRVPVRAEALDQTHIVTLATGRRWLAVLRLATGFIFLWAFLDKAFGLGFSTPAERAWINGGAPSQGFLNSDAVVGPLKPLVRARSPVP